MYQFIERLHTLYGLLQDELSKEIFQARFAFDMEPSLPNIKHLVSLGSCDGQGILGWLSWSPSWTEALRKLNKEYKKIILYGAGYVGRIVATALKFEQIDFYGFCASDAESFPDGLLGKPVLRPDELLAHGDEYYVIPTVNRDAYSKIFQTLHESNYPKEHVLDWLDGVSFQDKKQYFEFPELYRPGTAFIDGGCYDCETSRIFAEWCEGAYSSIIAFEPDPANYAECREKIKNSPLPNFQLVNASLSSQEGTAVFDAENSSSSRIIPAGTDSGQAKNNSDHTISIRTAAIDDIVGERTVGFIKMDIEGAEFDALHGAKNTILRDKPLLAICVYHLRGDVFAIMDYLHQLLPEYRFLLRHYSPEKNETVLYASVDL